MTASSPSVDRGRRPAARDRLVPLLRSVVAA
jgi:hypothetical protein